MKKSVVLLILVLGFVLLAFAESYRRAASDMYTESYMAAMKRQSGAGVAEIRAENYRVRGEVCDEHHDCAVTGSAKQPREESRSSQDQSESIKPHVYAPTWM